MEVESILGDKTLKPKEKIEVLSHWLLEGKFTSDHLLEFASSSKDSNKASCIEVLEYATKQKPAIANKKTFQFVTEALKEKAPRIKWESAKVIGNTAQLFSNDLEEAIANLLTNSEHEGTVVRWSAAFALGEILKLKTKHDKELILAFESICKREEKNSIKKIYYNAIKKASK